MKIVITGLFLFSTAYSFSQGIGLNEASLIESKEKSHFSSQVADKYQYIVLREPGCYEVKSSDNNKYGFIDSMGRELIPCVYDKVELQANLIRVTAGPSIGLYNYKGQQLLPVEYQRLFDMENSPYYMAEKNGLWGVVDPFSPKNKTIIPVQYSRFGCLNGVMIGSGNCSQFYFKKDSTFGIMDIHSRIIIPPVYTSLESAPTGIYKACKNGKFGYIDSVNNTVIPFVFDDCQPLIINGLTLAQKEKWGLINNKGEFVIAPQYDEVFTWQQGVLRVKKNGKTGFIDEKGVEFIPCIYDAANAYYREGTLTVKLNGKLGIVDRKGKPLTELVYDKMYKFYYKHGIVRKGNYFGLLNNQGVEVLPCEYDKIEYGGNESIIIAWKNNGKTGYSLQKGKLEKLPN